MNHLMPTVVCTKNGHSAIDDLVKKLLVKLL